jgi:quinol monooxygenase YgiN
MSWRARPRSRRRLRRRTAPWYTSPVISVVRRFRVREGKASVVDVTRTYQRLTRRERGNVRCELWQTSGDPGTFTLIEVFRTAYDRTQHALSPHNKSWTDAVQPFLDGQMVEEQAEDLVSEPVPPPLPARERPAIESSKPFGGELVASATPSPSLKHRLPQLVVEVETIEVAAAFDHIPLRAAQPCAVVAAFLLDAEGANGVGRTVYRFTPPKSLPGSLVGAQRLLDVPLPEGAPDRKVAIVVASVEENGGRDVRAIYQAFADPHELSFWSRAESCPSPQTLEECGASRAFANRACRVEILRREQALHDAVDDDTWAGASLACLDLTADVPERLARFHTAADDRRNDWLMSLRCRLQ